MISTIGRYLTFCIALVGTLLLAGCGGDNGADGQDTGAISVTALDASGETVTDAQVTTSPAVDDLSHAPIGVYTVTASAAGYGTASEDVSVVAGQTSEVTLTLDGLELSGPYSGDELESCGVCHADTASLAPVSDYHGAANVGVALYDVTITDVTSDGTNGLTEVTFTVDDQDGDPVTGLDSDYVSASLSKLQTDTAGNTYWVPYYFGTETAGDTQGGVSEPDPVINGAIEGEVVPQAGGGSGTIAGTGTDGEYIFTFDSPVNGDVTIPGDTDPDNGDDWGPGDTIAFEPTLTHRVSLMMGGHGDPAAQPTYDFILSDGTAVDPATDDTRDIVSNTACKQCHGDEFHGHGGDRVAIEGCVTCHNPYTYDSGSGEAGAKVTADAQVLFHRIHMGSGLPTTYEWSHRGNVVEWSEVGFPADVRNCTKCHYEPDDETLADVDNWQSNPSSAACGSCHSDVDFETGDGHAEGARSDSDCATCHVGDGSENTHIQTAHNINRTYDFDIALSMSDPDGGTYYEAGEEPVVTVVLNDPDTGNPIDHTTLTEEKFQGDGHPALYLFVSGPRSDRRPVLTTAAARNSGMYASNALYLHDDSSEDDPRVTVTEDKIEYQLAAVPDDMTPGTYVAYVHAGYGPDYADGNTHSTELTTFQVGQVDEEPKIASGCNDCHGEPDAASLDGADFGVDNVMHGSRPFDVDYCGACHDYLTTSDGEGWAENRNGFGAGPISRRIHRLHSGASEDGGGDYSEVGFPQSTLACESCHGEETSGSHADNPNRLACTGCHEDESATSHAQQQTYDPTP